MPVHAPAGEVGLRSPAPPPAFGVRGVRVTDEAATDVDAWLAARFAGERADDDC